MAANIKKVNINKVKERTVHGRESAGTGDKRGNRKSFKGKIQNDGTVKPVE